MYSVLRRRSWVIVLVVGLALLALPASVGAASTTGNLVDQTQLVTVQEPVNPVFAIPGLFALTSEGLDLPALNATAKLNGLNFNNGFGFDTLTVNQKQPLVNPGFSLSDLQATVAGPAKGYSTNLTGHVEIGSANAPLQAKATVGALYDAVSGRSGVSVQDGSANLAAGPVNVALSGVNTGQGNIGFDALTVSQSQPLVSQGLTLSDLQATVAGPAQAYTSNLSGHVALGSANGPFQAAATLGAVYDIANGKAGVSVQDGSANLAAGPVSVALSGVNTGQGTLGFDALTVSQSQPLVSQGLTLSGLQATVGGADKAYASNLTGHIELGSANGPFQAAATVGAVYDVANRQMGLSVQDGSASLAAGPVNVALAGVNTGQGTLGIDTVTVSVPTANATVALNGYKNVNGLSDWDSLTVSQPQIQLGNVATISDLNLTVAGPSQGMSRNASAQYTINLGQLLQAQGQFSSTYDYASGRRQTVLENATATVGVPAANVTLNGISYGTNGMKVDTVTFQSNAINLQAELSNVTQAPGGGVTFDKALVRYVPPEQAGSQNPLAGFEFTITKTDSGYLVGTNALVNPAK